MQQNKKDSIIERILSSSKYRSIYPPTIKRVVEDVAARYPEKEVEKIARQKLHQIWGAYFDRPNFTRITRKIRERLESGESEEKILSDLLLMQSSTRERLEHLAIFYQKIFELTGVPDSIVEYGCGINPLTYRWMMGASVSSLNSFGQSTLSDADVSSTSESSLTQTSKHSEGKKEECSISPRSNFKHPKDATLSEQGEQLSKPVTISYTGTDVDYELIDLMNTVIEFQGLKDHVTVQRGDVLTDEPIVADLLLLLKVAPLLERQKAGSTKEILRKQPSRWMVISYPTRSLSGKDKGMKEHYEDEFYKIIESEGWKVKKIDFASEMVFVVER